MSPKEMTLGECLSQCGLRTLPKALVQGDNRIWINAIVLVSKGGLEEYCLANNNGMGTPSITRDFGTCRAISNIISIHPIECVSGKFTPDLRSDKAIITFLGKNGYDENTIVEMLSRENKTLDQIREDRAIVKTYINQVAIKLAKKTLAEEERCREIREYANRVRNERK